MGGGRWEASVWVSREERPRGESRRESEARGPGVSQRREGHARGSRERVRRESEARGPGERVRREGGSMMREGQHDERGGA